MSAPRSAPIVDHDHPFCDDLCRCTGCKPSKLVRRTEPTRRVEVAALVALASGLAAWWLR